MTLIIGDDHYNPADTVEVVRKLVEQDGVFAMAYGLGESTHGAVWKYLEERGVPDLFVGSGIRKWTDPLVKTRFGANPDYYTEGRMLGQYIAENYNGKKLGLLIQNDELGEDGEAGILKGLEGSDVEIVARETYEAVQFDATAQTQRLKNATDIVAAPPATANRQSAQGVARSADWDVPSWSQYSNLISSSTGGPGECGGLISVVFEAGLPDGRRRSRHTGSWAVRPESRQQRTPAARPRQE
jgi:ABC-type branched-subunit amino acid transport system substrate-binding protein